MQLCHLHEFADAERADLIQIKRCINSQVVRWNPSEKNGSLLLNNPFCPPIQGVIPFLLLPTDGARLRKCPQRLFHAFLLPDTPLVCPYSSWVHTKSATAYRKTPSSAIHPPLLLDFFFVCVFSLWSLNTLLYSSQRVCNFIHTENNFLCWKTFLPGSWHALKACRLLVPSWSTYN